MEEEGAPAADAASASASSNTSITLGAAPTKDKLSYFQARRRRWEDSRRRQEQLQQQQKEPPQNQQLRPKNGGIAGGASPMRVTTRTNRRELEVVRSPPSSCGEEDDGDGEEKAEDEESSSSSDDDDDDEGISRGSSNDDSRRNRGGDDNEVAAPPSRRWPHPHRHNPPPSSPSNYDAMSLAASSNYTALQALSSELNRYLLALDDEEEEEDTDDEEGEEVGLVSAPSTPEQEVGIDSPACVASSSGGASASLFGASLAGSASTLSAAPSLSVGGRGSSRGGAGGAAGSAAAPENDPRRVRDRVVELYREHNPTKLPEVDSLLLKYSGREDELLDRLRQKYGATASAYPLPPPPGQPGGAQCFLEFSSHPGRPVAVELFARQAPAACENFRALCLRPAGRGYRQSVVHRIAPGMCVQMGDYTRGDGTGGRSVYHPGQPLANGVSVDLWGNFSDERPFLRHSEAGLLSMANNGPNRNGSQFFFTLKPLPHLDGKHVVFGRVVRGMEVVQDIAQSTTVDDKQRPLLRAIRIVDCGQVLADGSQVRTENELPEGKPPPIVVPKPSEVANAKASSAGVPSKPSSFGMTFGFPSAASSSFSFASFSAAVSKTAPSCFALTSAPSASEADAAEGSGDPDPPVQAPSAAAALGSATGNRTPVTTAPPPGPDSEPGADLLQVDPPKFGSFGAATASSALASSGVVVPLAPSVPFSFSTFSPSSTLTSAASGGDHTFPPGSQAFGLAAAGVGPVPSVPFSFSPFSLPSTLSSASGVDAPAPSKSKDSTGVPYSRADGFVGSAHDDEEEDDEEWVPDEAGSQESGEDDDGSYDSDETPSSRSEDSDEEDDDDTHDVRRRALMRAHFPSAVRQGASGLAKGSTSATRVPAIEDVSVLSGTVPASDVDGHLESSGLLIGRPPEEEQLAAAPGDAAGGDGENHGVSEAGPSPPDEEVSVAEGKKEGPAFSLTTADLDQESGPSVGASVTSIDGFGAAFRGASADAPSLSFAGLASGALPAFGTQGSGFPTAQGAASSSSFFSAWGGSREPAPAFRSSTNAEEYRSASMDGGEDDSGAEDTVSASSGSESSYDHAVDPEEHPVLSDDQFFRVGCLAGPSPSMGSEEHVTEAPPELVSVVPTTDQGLAKHDAPTIALTEVHSADHLVVPVKNELADLVLGDAERADALATSADGPEHLYEPPNVYSISFSTVESSSSRDPLLQPTRKSSSAKGTLCGVKLQNLLDAGTTSIAVASPTPIEVDELGRMIVTREAAAEETTRDPACGLCWCLKSNSNGIAGNDDAATPGRATVVSRSDPDGVSSATDDKPMTTGEAHVDKQDLLYTEAIEPPEAPRLDADASGHDGCDSSPEKVPCSVENIMRTRPPSSSMRALGSASPSMSTDSEKDYVPDSLRVFVAEATLALHQEHRSFLTSVKEDGTFDIEDERLAHATSAATRATRHVLYPLAAEAPNSLSRRLLTPTARFQVLGTGEATKGQRPIIEAAPRAASKPFFCPSALPPPFDPALELRYAPLLVRCGLDPVAPENVKDAIPERHKVYRSGSPSASGLLPENEARWA